MSQNTNTKNDNITLSRFWQANLLPHTQFPRPGKRPWSLGNLAQLFLTRLRNLHTNFSPKYLAAVFLSSWTHQAAFQAPSLMMTVMSASDSRVGEN